MSDRLFWVVISSIWPSWRNALVIVEPATVIGWLWLPFIPSAAEILAFPVDEDSVYGIQTTVGLNG